MRLATLVLTSSVGLTGCLSGPGFMKQASLTLASNDSAPTPTAATVLSDTGGVLTAQISANSTSTQVVKASAASAIAGTAIAFPSRRARHRDQCHGAGRRAPRVEQLHPANRPQSVRQCPGGSADGRHPAGHFDGCGDAFHGWHRAACRSPFDRPGVNYAVLYNVVVASQNASQAGIIPASQLTVTGGVVSFQTTHFGAFQLVTASAPITVAIAVPTTQPVVTAQQAAAAPMQLDNFTPLVANDGATVTLTGKNFRPTMTIALAGKPVGSVNVASDASASFVVPTGTTYGFTDLTVAEDGTSETHKIFAMSDKTGLPLIAMDPSGVCSGVNYYDASGNKQTGTMTCNSTPAGVMLQSVYDPTASGTVTRAGNANTANSAASAGSAAYSMGQLGSTIAVTTNSAQLPVPGNGSAYPVTGNGTITSIASMPAGTRITLVFQDGAGVTFVHNDLMPPLLMLLPAMNIGFIAGDAEEFLSTGNGNWVQVSQAPRTPVALAIPPTNINMPTTSVYALDTASTSCPMSSNNSYATDTSLPLSAPEFSDETSSNAFVAPAPGIYQLQGTLQTSITASYPTADTYLYSYCFVSVYKNGALLTSNFGSTTNNSTTGSVTTGCTSLLSGQPYQLAQGDRLELKASFQACYNSNSSQTAPTPQTATILGASSPVTTGTATGTGTGVASNSEFGGGTSSTLYALPNCRMTTPSTSFRVYKIN